MARVLTIPIHSNHSIHQIIAGYKKGYMCFSKLIGMVARVSKLIIVDRVDRKPRNLATTGITSIPTPLKKVDRRWIGWIGR